MYYEITNGYSPIGDVYLLALCFVCFVIAKATFIKHSRGTKLFKYGLIVLVILCIANLCTYYSAMNEMSDFFILFSRDVYHSALMILFVLIECYIAVLIGLDYSGNSKNYFHVFRIGILINGLGILFDCISPLTHFGLYKSAAGKWIDPIWSKPYTICYVVNMLYIAILLILYRDKIIRVVRYVILLTQLISGTFVLIESIQGHNSYTTLTYALPVMAVLLMLHSNPYNIETGSFGADSFADYLNMRNENGKSDYYMCLKFDTNTDFVMPYKLGKAFYNFYVDYFDEAVLFNPATGCYVLAIKSENKNNYSDNINKLIYEVFPDYYEEYRINYKIIVINNSSFPSIKAFGEYANFFFSKIKINSTRIITEVDNTEYERQVYILSQILDIVNGKDLDDPRVLVYCQPIYNVGQKCFDTAESLMRLQLPQIGIVFPDEFIPIAEKNALIHGLSLIMLNKCCKVMEKLYGDCILKRISVNYSIVEMKSLLFIQEFKDIVRAHNIPFESIGVEFTESTNEDEHRTIVDIISKLKQLGAVTYLDDYGTGFSNLERVVEFNADIIKFDKSLVDLSEKTNVYTNMISHFAEAFKLLGCKVLFEGIETDYQEKMCQSIKADYLQGYFYSKPIPIEELESFLNNN